MKKALENCGKLKTVVGVGNGGFEGTSRGLKPQGQLSLPLQGLVLITFLYLSLVSFVKPSHKSCKVGLFSGYHHPSPIIDRSGRWFTISQSPACRLLLFYLQLLSPALEWVAAPKAFPTKPFAACCICLLGVLCWRLL